MGNEFAVEADGLAGFWVAAYAWCAVVQGEAAEAADFDAVSGGEALGHLLEHSLDSQLHILG